MAAVQEAIDPQVYIEEDRSFSEEALVATQEEATFLSRIRETGSNVLASARAGLEYVRDMAPAAASVATLMVVGLETAPAMAQTRHPLSPGQVLRGMMGAVNLKYSPGINMNVQNGVLKVHRAVLNGECNPKSPFDPPIKKVDDRPNVQIQWTCEKEGGKYKVLRLKRSHLATAKVDYTQDLNKLGDRAARSVGVSPNDYGNTTRVSASRAKAVVSYERVPNVEGHQQLRSIVFRSHHRPQETFYK